MEKEPSIAPKSQFISPLSKRDRALRVLVYIQMFHQNAIALTIGGMSFSMPIYRLVEGHTIDIQLSECITDYLIHDDTVHEAFLYHAWMPA
jgi:hypothetical protein